MLRGKIEKREKHETSAFKEILAMVDLHARFLGENYKNGERLKAGEARNK